jgi:hypothetical protein
MEETVSRLKQDIAQEGIVFFLAVDQSSSRERPASNCALQPC